MSNKVMVTGASGFIGRALTKELLKRGDFVYAVVRNMSKLRDLAESPNLKIVEASMNDYHMLPNFINEHIDIFYHLSWDGYGNATNDPVVQFKNVINSIDAYQSAVKIGVKKFIFTGTAHEFLKKNIDGKPQLCSVYGSAKASFKQIGRILSQSTQTKFNSTIFSHVFGDGDYNKRSSYAIIKKLLNNESPVVFQPDALYDWTYIDDVIDGIIKVSETEYSCRDYYVGSNKLRTLKDIINDVKNAIAPDIELSFNENSNEGSYVDYSMTDLNLLGNDTGFIIENNFLENIRKTALWIEENSF